MIAEFFDYKKESKWLKKWYWTHGQRLTLDTFEVREPDSCYYDVCLYDMKKKESVKFLFTVANMRIFQDVDKRVDGSFFQWYDAGRMASCPYYFDRQFVINKWTGVTDADIHKAAEYYIFKVLDLKYSIWNIQVVDQLPDSK